MAVKLRLARHGRKSKPYYYIIAADTRAPRDGKFIERIGSYNPVTNPATIVLDFDRALDWMMKGAQPTDTVRRILSYKGVMMKKHLLEGVKKGAFDDTEAETRFEKWETEKNSKISAIVSDLDAKDRAETKDKLAAETKIKEDRAIAIAKKYAVEEEKVEEATEEVAEETTEEVVVAETEAKEEVPAKEEVKAEVKVEEVKEEAPAKEEVKAEEVKEAAPAKEEVKAEVKEETKAEAKPEEEKTKE